MLIHNVDILSLFEVLFAAIQLEFINSNKLLEDTIYGQFPLVLHEPSVQQKVAATWHVPIVPSIPPVPEPPPPVPSALAWQAPQVPSVPHSGSVSA